MDQILKNTPLIGVENTTTARRLRKPPIISIWLWAYESVDLSRKETDKEDRIFKLLRSRGIDSKESDPSAYVAWRASTRTLFLPP